MFRALIPFALLLSFVTHQASSQVTDTLGWDNYHQGTDTLYSSPNGGYVCGNNGYGDRAKARSFSHDRPFWLRKVLLRFGAVVATSNDTSSVVRVNVYLNNGAGFTTFGGQDSIAPDSVLSFVDVPVTSILSGGVLTLLDISDFSEDAVIIRSRFSIGIDLTRLAAGDTVSLYSTVDGDALARQDNWEQVANGSWITVLSPYSWELDVDLAIFAEIDDEDVPAGIREHTTSLSVYPNPTDGPVTAHLDAYDKWTSELYSMEGHLLMQDVHIGDKIMLDMSNFPSGVHVLKIHSNTQVYVSRIVIR